MGPEAALREFQVGARMTGARTVAPVEAGARRAVPGAKALEGGRVEGREAPLVYVVEMGEEAWAGVQGAAGAGWERARVAVRVLLRCGGEC